MAWGESTSSSPPVLQKRCKLGLGPRSSKTPSDRQTGLGLGPTHPLRFNLSYHVIFRVFDLLSSVNSLPIFFYRFKKKSNAHCCDCKPEKICCQICQQRLSLMIFFTESYIWKLISNNWFHSSEIRGLCLMKWPSKCLNNLPYFWNMNIHIFYFVLYFVQRFMING